MRLQPLSTLNASGSSSERLRSSRHQGESRQKPLDFIFLVEGEGAVAPMVWPSQGLLSRLDWGSLGAKAAGATNSGLYKLFKNYVLNPQGTQHPFYFGPRGNGVHGDALDIPQGM